MYFRTSFIYLIWLIKKNHIFDPFFKNFHKPSFIKNFHETFNIQNIFWFFLKNYYSQMKFMSLMFIYSLVLFYFCNILTWWLFSNVSKIIHHCLENIFFGHYFSLSNSDLLYLINFILWYSLRSRNPVNYPHSFSLFCTDLNRKEDYLIV